MKFHLTFWSLFASLLLLAGCRLQDIRTVEIHSPQIRGEAARPVIEAALRPLRGVKPKRVQFDYEKGVVTVTYDSMMVAVKNIEFAFVEAGFDANGLKGDEAARKKLPAGLQ